MRTRHLVTETRLGPVTLVAEGDSFRPAVGTGRSF